MPTATPVGTTRTRPPRATSASPGRRETVRCLGAPRTRVRAAHAPNEDRDRYRFVTRHRETRDPRDGRWGEAPAEIALRAASRHASQPASFRRTPSRATRRVRERARGPAVHGPLSRRAARQARSTSGPVRLAPYASAAGHRAFAWMRRSATSSRNNATTSSRALPATSVTTRGFHP